MVRVIDKSQLMMRRCCVCERFALEQRTRGKKGVASITSKTSLTSKTSITHTEKLANIHF